MRLYRSAEERLERREALKTYLLGLAVIALVTAAVVVVPLVRADGLDSGAGPEVASMIEDPAFQSAETMAGRPDGQSGGASNDQSGGSGEIPVGEAGTPTEAERPAVELAALAFETPVPVVTFERSEPEEYLVDDGETLSEIAALFGLGWEDLARFNGIRNPDRLRAGQRIMIPPESDTLLQSEKQ